MRKLTLSIVALAVLVPSAQAAPVEVLVKDDFFKPKQLTIKKDRRVRWLWRGSNPHNVAIRRKGATRFAKKSAIKTSGRFTYQFQRTGTWNVLCEIHGDMKMRVVVRSS